MSSCEYCGTPNCGPLDCYPAAYADDTATS